MMRSLNEIQGMVLKAARGAGIPLGHCEELAVAAGALAQCGALSGLPEVLAFGGDVVLQERGEDAVILTGASAVMVGHAGLDAMACGAERVRLCGVEAMDVLAGLVAARGGVVMAKGDGEVILSASDTPAIEVVGPIEVNDAVWAALDGFACKTYVPATEASRLSGAGAGLTDND